MLTALALQLDDAVLGSAAAESSGTATLHGWHLCQVAEETLFLLILCITQGSLRGRSSAQQCTFVLKPCDGLPAQTLCGIQQALNDALGALPPSPTLQAVLGSAREGSVKGMRLAAKVAHSKPASPVRVSAAPT